MKAVPDDDAAANFLLYRSRRGLWLLFAGCFVPLLTDLPLVHPYRDILLAADVVRLLVPAVCLFVASRSESPQVGVSAIWLATAFLIAQGPFGTIWRSVDNGMISVVVAAGLCVSMAAFLPWGWRRHALLVVIAVAELAWEFQWQAAGPDATTTPFLLGQLCAVFSLPGAFLQERDERAKTAARRGLRDARAATESLAVELAGRVERRSDILDASTENLLGACRSLASSLRGSLQEVKRLAGVATAASRAGASETGSLLARIDAATDRMNATLDALLSYVDLARCPLRLELVDLSASATRALTARRERDPQRVVHATVQPGMQAWGDRTLVEEAVESLVDNAWKFSSESSEAQVEVGLRPDHNGGCAFFVRDNGTGLDRRFVDKLFLPFERLHEVEAFPGLGISLARVRRIVSRHGGIVRGGPLAGGGAEFGFVLPAPPNAALGWDGPTVETTQREGNGSTR